MTISAAERLRRFYAVFSGQDQVLIVINADPDAIASAMAVKRLLWRKVAGVTISNINVMKRPDNITMVRLMGIDLVHLSKVDKRRYSRFVIVDSQPCHNEAFETFTPDAVIDHHPKTNAEASFLDIRPNYGATASIMTEYLRAAKIRPSAKLAAGLYHAIRTDTNNFAGQALIEDVRAFQFLFRHANIHLARKIEQADLNFNFLKFFKTALDSMKRRRGRLFAHLGSVPNPDVCVIIADFFMRVDTVNWSIISGLYKKKLIIVFRNDGLREDAGKLANHRFDQIGSAGGHKSMARAEIPFANLKAHVDPRDGGKLLKWIIGQIEKSAKKR